MECLICLSLSGERRISPGPFIHKGAYRVVDHAIPASELTTFCKKFTQQFQTFL
ncbi:MAG TPA: hypothetical protein VKV19_18235 [Ktedonobacteraceae bacterium]|nr:hypothetical protein [Ktedonobacteraceae bacterium]